MLVGCSQQEWRDGGGTRGGWLAKRQQYDISGSAGSEVSVPEKITSLLAKRKCLTSQAMEEKETRSSRGVNEHRVTAFGRS